MTPGEYPVTLEVEYDENLSRWLIFVKWLLAIPHYIVLLFLVDRGVRRGRSSPSSRSCSRGATRAGCSTSWSATMRWSSRVNAYAHLADDGPLPAVQPEVSRQSKGVRYAAARPPLCSARPMNVYNKQYLMTAGPTPLPPAVSQVMAEPILYHRAPAFVEIYARVLERLKMVFQTAERGAAVRRLGHRARWSRRSRT